jgi:NAD(P)-dependent dehydrogenase (short-subunit alcohol dehydrogenase family)
MSSILIAGASNGIGRATAAELARRSRRAVATGAHAVRAKGTHTATRKSRCQRLPDWAHEGVGGRDRALLGNRP